MLDKILSIQIAVAILSMILFFEDRFTEFLDSLFEDAPKIYIRFLEGQLGLIILNLIMRLG